LSRKELLDAVAVEVVVCTKCPLWKNRRNAVPGVGNPESQIIFVGEAPGQSEDNKGEPFVGDAGKFLDTLLSGIRLSREDVFITNVVKCRPPRNRGPQPKEIRSCTPYLERQIKIIKPKFIVTLGSHSTAYIFSRGNMSFTGITKNRGKFYEANLHGLRTTVFPTFHPAAALYNEEYKRLLSADFKLLEHKLLKKTT